MKIAVRSNVAVGKKSESTNNIIKFTNKILKRNESNVAVGRFCPVKCC
ncbi:20549_t:CDS:1, partial [Racocetra persica]